MKKYIRIYMGTVLAMILLFLGFALLENQKDIKRQGQLKIELNRKIETMKQETQNEAERQRLSEMGDYFYESMNGRKLTRSYVPLCVLSIVLVTCGFLLVYYEFIRPLERLEKYPEKLSKGYIRTHLPESKYRNMGKFVWGMNLLADTLEENRNSLKMAEAQRQTLLTGVAHGVKTPVANIKLYAEAIETGLYQPDGVINEKDREVASKIKSNAEEIEQLVKQFLEQSSQGIYGFEIQPKRFYIEEIGKSIEEEFKNRFVVSHIPYEIICERNLIMNSDPDGILYVLTQFIENAIKYGDGTGISMFTEVEEDTACFSIRNKGNLLPKEELNSVFKSFWRGSNAEKVSGSGMGMYMAQEMARNLHGHVYAKRMEENGNPQYGEMEFSLILPLE